DLARRLDARQLWHREVHQHDVGEEVARELDAPATILGFTHHLDVLELAEKEAQAAAERGVVVDDQHPNGHGSRSAACSVRCTGSSTCTSVPPSGRTATVHVPPSSAARSCIDARPTPTGSPSATPDPSSPTSMVSDCDTSSRSTHACVAPECRTT